MWRRSRNCSPKEHPEPRFWAALALVFALLVYAGVRWIPRPPPPRTPLQPVDIPAVVIPIVFEDEGPLPASQATREGAVAEKQRVLNINRATAKELEALPGIGPVLAARIVAHREAHGPFRTVDDLLAVSGIGPKTLAGFRDLVTVDEDR